MEIAMRRAMSKDRPDDEGKEKRKRRKDQKGQDDIISRTLKYRD
jgi:hypothetical protein